jgi:transposase
VIKLEDWAEIRRLHRAEGVSISEIARLLGIARNTVRSALASDRPPRYERPARGSKADAVEPQVRALLAQFPRMPATVIAERIRWPYSLTTLKDRLRQIRPEYIGIDPADRVSYEPGQITQCDLWFPETKIPVGRGQERILPVLVMTLAFSRFLSATMIPSRQAGDLLSGMWALISQVGRVTKTLVWDRESAIGGTGRVSAPAAAFAGTLATRIQLAPPRDPEFKGLVERNNGYFETSFLPGRAFVSPEDFNTQLAEWLGRANARTVRSLQGRPIDLVDTDYQTMIPLPPVEPPIGLNQRIRLARDYYVRVDTVDYSVDPRVIGRFVDVTASPTAVVVCCQGQVVAEHRRSWAKQAVVTDPAHVTQARQLRRHLAQDRHSSRIATPGTAPKTASGARQHPDGHVVELRALPDYDALFGVDFTPAATPAATPTGMGPGTPIDPSAITLSTTEASP